MFTHTHILSIKKRHNSVEPYQIIRKEISATVFPVMSGPSFRTTQESNSSPLALCCAMFCRMGSAMGWFGQTMDPSLPVAPQPCISAAMSEHGDTA